MICSKFKCNDNAVETFRILERNDYVLLACNNNDNIEYQLMMSNVDYKGRLLEKTNELTRVTKEAMFQNCLILRDFNLVA